MSHNKKENAGEPTKIVYYCKDCEKIVKAQKITPRKLKFKCQVCQGKNVSFGTEKSIKNHYRIKDNVIEEDGADKGKDGEADSKKE